jgi:hypothetical protein
MHHRSEIEINQVDGFARQRAAAHLLSREALFVDNCDSPTLPGKQIAQV